MRTLIVLLTSVLLLSPLTAQAQDNRAALEAATKALGATDLKSIEIPGRRHVLLGRAKLHRGHPLARVQRAQLHPRGELRHGHASR